MWTIFFVQKGSPLDPTICILLSSQHTLPSNGYVCCLQNLRVQAGAWCNALTRFLIFQKRQKSSPWFSTIRPVWNRKKDVAPPSLWQENSKWGWKRRNRGPTHAAKHNVFACSGGAIAQMWWCWKLHVVGCTHQWESLWGVLHKVFKRCLNMPCWMAKLALEGVIPVGERTPFCSHLALFWCHISFEQP